MRVGQGAFPLPREKSGPGYKARVYNDRGSIHSPQSGLPNIELDGPWIISIVCGFKDSNCAIS